MTRTPRRALSLAALASVSLLACRAGAQEKPGRAGVAPVTSRRAIAADGALGDLGACRKGAGRRPNRLIHERSPYLREHAFDPVEWFAWGPEAFAEAKRRDVPLLVSSGYSTCHWCHVMHRESFEDADVAGLLNASYVAVKVDREELPDVDERLIRAVQAIQGSAGWPCTVFLGHDGRPFYGGTYFPKHAFVDRLETVRDLWKDPAKRKTLGDDASQLAEFLAKDEAPAPGAAPKLGPALVMSALEAFAKHFDAEHKGFGHAPKFPRAPDLLFLLRSGQKESARLALETLDVILERGIHDHLAGGFHRYATDDDWNVPHFEKTLYDQALLVEALADAHRLTREARYERGLRATIDYVLRDLALPSGGFAAAEDADSAGEEGRFYTWTSGELATILGEKTGRYAAARFGVAPGGSGPVDGRSTLSHAKPPSEAAAAAGAPGEGDALEAATLEGLRRARAERVRPLRDEKVLTGWNGLMIAALARAGATLGDARALEAARAAARFVEARLVRADGRLLRRVVGTEARFLGSLEDHAYLLHGYLELHQGTLELVWLEKALALREKTFALFTDAKTGRLLSRARDGDPLVPPGPADLTEGALPAPAALFLLDTVRLAALTGNEALAQAARTELDAATRVLAGEPYAVPTALAAVSNLVSDGLEIVVAAAPGSERDALLGAIRKRPFVRASLLLVEPGQEARAVALAGDVARGRTVLDGKPQVFVCRGKTCLAPVGTVEALEKALDGLKP